MFKKLGCNTEKRSLVNFRGYVKVESKWDRGGNFNFLRLWKRGVSKN